FATQNLEGNINYKIIENGYQLEILNSNSIDDLDSLIEKSNIYLLVIDHYDIDYIFEKQLKTQNPNLKILSFDDTYEKHYCDILLNHNISANRNRYKDLIPNFCELRCGADYTLLRDEFYQEKNIKRDKLYNILIAMGGADTANLNILILKSISQDLKVAIITTVANANLEELKEYIKNKSNITLFINSNEVAKIINQSRLAIITPSVTVNEVYFMGIDFIAIKTADNQEDMYSYLFRNGYLVLEKFNRERLKALIDIKSNIEFINFTELSSKDKKMILEWRNHPNIRKWMYNRELISLDEHLNYIDSLSTKKDRLYFMVKYKSEVIGVIDFTNIDYINKKTDFGIYAKPNSRGFGKILMSSIINYAFYTLKVDRLIAEVFTKNAKAISLYKKFNFKQIDIKVVDSRDMIVMELKNENR
ncbi:MAG: UDP-2,4-diacetamido-2,4,6-trideoxy-beta-L-altropyranose hydrolase, partial [Sulfurovaceae bacterium]|nr:UDP-2,4-diacetamido-2,4,6-trideoxy-beta-L-altropyranose hydrolase [Sulfurovaceae bacterium]